ncbi:multicopper oxidase family protein [Cohnella zeiphila]|uniref:Multicopper oxidase family protein n=1 Tax=Cohnella zeiphila TaxID=2761120 RepID=A0A7X0VUW2_9BACL|nr:multicopper oxidase family protein [Cohnella zeiphila]MBB6730810.1 multicopper oxidase family protein [Cohnella zeiphila]
MTGDLFGPGGMLAFGMMIVWGVAVYRLGRIGYAASYKRMRRRIRGALAFMLLGCGMAAAKLAYDVSLWPGGWADWRNKLILQVPLLAAPVALTVLLSVPKLWAAHRACGKEKPEELPDGPARRRTADPAAVVPAQAAAVGSCLTLYLTWFTAVPIGWADLIVPLPLMIVASAGLWFRQRNRRRALGKLSWTLPPLAARTAKGSLALAVVAACLVFWIRGEAEASKLPDRIGMQDQEMAGMSGMDGMAGMEGMEHEDGQAAAGSGISVASLTGPAEDEPDDRFVLTAEQSQIKLASGTTVDAWTFDGQLPGPELRVKQGDLVEVTLRNRDIADGVTLHWHGLDVPNAEDGVAGVTQDAVMPGRTFVYRFVAGQAGTYWYHTHQVSDEGVARGLFGALVVEPKSGPVPEKKDIVVATHRWQSNDGYREAFGSADTLQRQTVAPGTTIRLRLINTSDDLEKLVLAGASYRVVAIDGTDVNGPEPLSNRTLQLAAGGRMDLSLTMPDTPVLLCSKESACGDGGESGLLLTPDGQTGSLPQVVFGEAFDPAAYGRPAATPFGADSRFDRDYRMEFDEKLGLYDGHIAFMYTINGRSYPDTPMFMVSENDLVKFTIVNRSSAHHPLHLHGHKLLVLSRNGKEVSGSPWWSDTLDIGPGERYEIAFRADNPGIWMDHCHNLQHASSGMMTHLAYEGVTSPFAAGRATVNHPE